MYIDIYIHMNMYCKRNNPYVCVPISSVSSIRHMGVQMQQNQHHMNMNLNMNMKNIYNPNKEQPTNQNKEA